MVNPDNTYTEKTYDALGHVLTETDEAGQTTSYTYDANGRVKTMTDRFGKITRYTYNNAGWLLSEKTPDNGVTTYEYDYEGNQTKITGAKENQKERKLDRNSITLTYDELGNVTTKTDELGKLTKYAYNDSSELIRETKPDGSKVRYGYYLNGNLNYTIDEEEHKTTYTYNKLWQLIMVTDAKGNSTHYEYDEYGNQNKVIDALGNETNYTYNTFHEVTSMTDAKGNQYTYEYDKNGNQTKIVNPLGEETRFTYNKRNQVKTMVKVVPVINEAGKKEIKELTTTYYYDKLGRVLKVEDPQGRSVSYQYIKKDDKEIQIQKDGFYCRTNPFDGKYYQYSEITDCKLVEERKKFGYVRGRGVRETHYFYYLIFTDATNKKHKILYNKALFEREMNVLVSRIGQTQG